MVKSSVDPGAERVPFGPARDTLPSAWISTVDYRDLPVTLTLRLSFAGQRVRLDELTVIGKDGHEITARDVAHLEVDRAVHDATRASVQPGDGAHVSRRPGAKPTPDELELVAAVYWFHHVSRGQPRQAVMALWDVSRATANRWLRRCRELFDMPEIS
jgi:hypothetical protein